MKSRNFLPNISAETTGSTAKGFVLARSPQAATSDVAAVAAARRFELKHNQSPRFARRRAERRQGQALLLAVLIMLLAALLGAGFLAVVSGNLNQSARIADKTRAIEASRAGIAYANAQLSGSSQGDLWRPIDVSPAPAPGSNNPSYDFYYSQLDKVQGWAAKTPPQTTDTFPNADYPVANYNEAAAFYRNATYGKFPDPNQPASDAPKFLVKVQELPSVLPTNNPEYEHRGEIKITSIGLSDDDPNVFHRAVAYKTGRKKSPWAIALRSVSNWRFGTTDDNTGVPYAKVVADQTIVTPTSNVTVAVDTTNSPAFLESEVPFNVVIIKKDTVTPANSTVRGAVVTKVDTTMGTVLTLARLDSSLAKDEVIQKAAAIGTAGTIDLLNTGQTPTPGNPMTFPTQDQPNGILANGSLWLQNQVRLSNLSSKLTSDVTKVGTQLITSGSLVIDNSAPNISKKIVPSANGDMVASAGGYDLVPSNVNYPGNNIVLTAAAVSNGVEKTDLINDGWDKIGSVKTLGLEYTPSTPRTVEPFTPARIDSATNLARYRALTRNSAEGVYIDNRDDVEKVGTVPMTQAQLVEMLNSPISNPLTDAEGRFYTKNSPQPLPTVTNVSLEQRHLRGWVGNDEFIARGALVELVPGTTPKIRVTHDARSDANPNGPDLNKTFRNGNGNLRPGVYSQELPWPSNGTLFAEGNIRIRGSVDLSSVPIAVAANYPSLTVVSMNNIYIEGSLSVDNTTIPDPNDNTKRIPDPNRKKLMLLAKKNVIVNPTRAVLARTDVQTVATNTTGRTIGAAPATFDLPVANAYAFNRGDYVTFVAQKTINDPTVVTIRGLVTSAQTPTSTQITIVTPNTGYLPGATNATVRSPLEKRDDDGTGTPNRLFFSLVDTENAINRRIVAPIYTYKTASDPNDPNRSKLLFDHVGELKVTGTTKEGLNIKAEDFDTPANPSLVPRPGGFTAVLTNKQPLLGTSQDINSAERGVTTANKVLRTYNNFTAPDDVKSFSLVPQPNPKPLSQLVSDIRGTEDSRSMPDQGYRYTASLTNTTAEFAALPSHALAGVGLRYDPGTLFVPPVTSPANNRRQDFNKTAALDGFTIPLATSVEYNLNGGLSNLLPVVGTRVTKYIGFSPDPADNDDVLTVDSSFYQLKTEISKSTIDARVFDAPIDATGLTTSFITTPPSIVLKRSAALSAQATSDLLPDYELRSMKLESVNLSSNNVKPVTDAIQINAFVYAQEGSWFVIPGDYFRSNPPVRGEINAGTQALTGSYIDYNGSKTPDTNEYILQGATKIADLNRNGRVDGGEKEAALRFVRYNTAPIQFYGAIVENQTAVVADVKDAAGNTVDKAKGAVQDWMDKWATYDDTTVANTEVGKPAQFKFITYAYDPTLANGNVGANQLRVPVTDELLYQQ